MFRKSEKLGFMKSCHEKIFFVGSILASLGILLVTVGGSWDITNHLLNKPETFFSPSHALMYCGVLVSLIGVALSLVSWRNFTLRKHVYLASLKFKLVGIVLLTGAGPFDFVWHSNFGLDGLLSPPHLTLIFGMLLCSIGGMLGITRYVNSNNLASFPIRYVLVLATLPVWLAGSGVVSSLSLPFSNTDYFEFNPEPTFAFIVATSAYPFLISFMALLTSGLSHFRFGMISIVGGLFLLIYGSTAIVPNFALTDSAFFYSLNLIPFVISDVMISLKKPKMLFFVGSVLGSSFYMMYYPYVMYTFNEVFVGKLVSPSMIYFVYFEMIENVFLITIIPAILSGVFAAVMTQKLSKIIA